MTKDKHLNKILLSLILIILQIVVLDAKEFETHRIKTKHFLNGLTNIKLLLKNDMSTASEAKRKNTVQHFIKNVRYFDGDSLVYNAILTPYIAKNPILKFRYSGNTSSIGVLETIDNNNNLLRQENVIKTAHNSRGIPILKKVQEDKQIVNIASPAIQNQFGKRSLMKSKNIKIIAPDITPNPSAIPIKIQSNIKAKSVALFATESANKVSYFDIKNGTIVFDNNDLALVYKNFIQERSIIDFDVKIKLSYGENSKVLVVVEAEDGNLYMAEKLILISICIDSGG